MKVKDLERACGRGLRMDHVDSIAAIAADGRERHATFRAMAEAYLDAGGSWCDVVRVAVLLAPDAQLRWPIARICFERLPPPLSAYAETLGPENWREAQDAAQAYARANGRDEAGFSAAAAAYACTGNADAIRSDIESEFGARALACATLDVAFLAAIPRRFADADAAIVQRIVAIALDAAEAS